MFIPRLQDLIYVIHDGTANAIQLIGGEAVIIGQRQRFQPEFARFPLASHVNVLGSLQSKL
jgi:hypothetical protein